MSRRNEAVSDTGNVIRVLPTIVTMANSDEVWIKNDDVRNALDGVESFLKYASKFTPLVLVKQDIPLVANAARSVQTFMNNRVADITDVRDNGDSVGLVVGAAVSRPFLRMAQGAVNGIAGFVELGTDLNSRATAWSGIKTFAEHPIDNTATGVSNYWNNTSWNEKLEDGFVAGYGAGLSGGTKLVSRFVTSPHIQSPLYFDTSVGRLNSGLPMQWRSPILPKRIFDPEGNQIPFGFNGYDDYVAFTNSLKAGLPENTTIIFKGSSVTGKSSPFSKNPNSPFDFGRVSDFDIALVNDDLYLNALELGRVNGFKVKTLPDRIGPLSNDQARFLGCRT